jgi:hypothetical protein
LLSEAMIYIKLGGLYIYIQISLSSIRLDKCMIQLVYSKQNYNNLKCYLKKGGGEISHCCGKDIFFGNIKLIGSHRNFNIQPDWTNFILKLVFSKWNNNYLKIYFKKGGMNSSSVWRIYIFFGNTKRWIFWSFRTKRRLIHIRGPQGILTCLLTV